MPDFAPYRKRRAIPQKGLERDLYETKKDIRRAKRGEETEASLPEMRDTKRRLKQELHEANEEEKKGMIRQLDPLQMADPRLRQKVFSA